MTEHSESFAVPEELPTVPLRELVVFPHMVLPIYVTRERSIALRVTNYGSSLPDSLSGDLFNSMISVRNDGNREEPHLGLGLYIVRLIAEFHGAEVSARNLDGDAIGVCFEVVFPGADHSP